MFLRGCILSPVEKEPMSAQPCSGNLPAYLRGSWLSNVRSDRPHTRPPANQKREHLPSPCGCKEDFIWDLTAQLSRTDKDEALASNRGPGMRGILVYREIWCVRWGEGVEDEKPFYPGQGAVLSLENTGLEHIQACRVNPLLHRA